MNRSEEINFCHVWKINYFFLFFFLKRTPRERIFIFVIIIFSTFVIIIFFVQFTSGTKYSSDKLNCYECSLLSLSLSLFRSSLFLAFVFSLWHVLFSATTVSTPFSDKKSPVLSDSVVEIRNNFRAGFSTQHTLISVLHPYDPVKASLFDPLTLALLLPCEVWISLSLPLFFFCWLLLSVLLFFSPALCQLVFLLSPPTGPTA